LLVILSGALLLIARLRHDLSGIIRFGLIAGLCFALTLAPYLLYNLSVTGACCRRLPPPSRRMRVPCLN
ncbi:hypothetical protein QQ056_17295, partial [Oscillatoria laete-virens NRMC-F 0139]